MKFFDGTFLAFLALVASLADVGWAADPKVELTVYNTDLGLVRERRMLELPAGKGEIRFTDVASQIDATSVLFKSLDDKNVVVLDQNYEYDLVSSDKLLQKYVDKSITVLTKEKGDLYEGTLLSFDGNQLILKSAKGLAMVNRGNIQDIKFESLPEGLITKPTLNWLVEGGKGGKQTCEIAYLTGGINWRCDYTVVVSEDDTLFKDFGGWVTINNRSGAAFQDAKLKLIAGDVHRVERPRAQYAMKAMEAMEAGKAAGDGFAEKSFFEYHLYTLGRLVTVKDNQIKQEELLTSHDVLVTKLYEFDHSRGQKVAVKLEFKNDEKSRLGMPLPLGRVRVYKEDKVGKSLEFIGEDNLEHTPKDEKRRLTMGNAFDLVGEWKQTDTKNFGRANRISYEVKLRNHKDKESVVIAVIEHFGGEWEVMKEGLIVGPKDKPGQAKPVEYVKKDATTAEWNVEVPAGHEAVLTYTVEQRW